MLLSAPERQLITPVVRKTTLCLWVSRIFKINRKEEETLNKNRNLFPRIEPRSPSQGEETVFRSFFFLGGGVNFPIPLTQTQQNREGTFLSPLACILVWKAFTHRCNKYASAILKEKNKSWNTFLLCKEHHFPVSLCLPLCPCSPTEKIHRRICRQNCLDNNPPSSPSSAGQPSADTWLALLEERGTRGGRHHERHE